MNILYKSSWKYLVQKGVNEFPTFKIKVGDKYSSDNSGWSSIPLKYVIIDYDGVLLSVIESSKLLNGDITRVFSNIKRNTRHFNILSVSEIEPHSSIYNEYSFNTDLGYFVVNICKTRHDHEREYKAKYDIYYDINGDMVREYVNTEFFDIFVSCGYCNNLSSVYYSDTSRDEVVNHIYTTHKDDVIKDMHTSKAQKYDKERHTYVHLDYYECDDNCDFQSEDKEEFKEHRYIFHVNNVKLEIRNMLDYKEEKRKSAPSVFDYMLEATI